MGIVRCKQDAMFEQDAKRLQAALHSELGSVKGPLPSGYYPIDWKAVERTVVRFSEVVTMACTHRSTCKQCRRDMENGYQPAEVSTGGQDEPQSERSGDDEHQGADGDGFPNLAGHIDPDPILREELTAAGITHFTLPFRDKGEVGARVRGHLDPSGWSFKRAWRYWIAAGPGIPPEDAERLHERFGRAVRVQGHCNCLGPGYCKGFAVGMYHVDTPRGLEALADLIIDILARNGHADVILPTIAEP